MTSSILNSTPTAASFVPGELWPDDNGVHINAHGGGILEHDGTYYWFGEHKIAGTAGNEAHVGVHVYSSRDLYSWKDEGIALSVSSDPGSDITDGCILERPKVIHNRATGKFIMWFHLELKGQSYSAARSGVAVADVPAGPYTYISSFRPNAGVWPINVTEQDKAGGLLASGFAGGQYARDMNLFVDDDGAAYHIYSSEDNYTMHVSRLTDDYLAPAGEYSRIFIRESREAPAPFKNDGRYYIVTSGCTGWAPNEARLAVADNIFGPYIDLGNPCLGTQQQIATTYNGQSTYVLPLAGRPGEFIFIADRWQPDNAIDGRYLWLPLRVEAGIPVIEWRDSWRI